MSADTPRTLGYARVSTVGQTLAAQLDRLRAAGCRPIFQEKVSGAKADRKQLAAMLRGLQSGSTLATANGGMPRRCAGGMDAGWRQRGG